MYDRVWRVSGGSLTGGVRLDHTLAGGGRRRQPRRRRTLLPRRVPRETVDTPKRCQHRRRGQHEARHRESLGTEYVSPSSSGGRTLQYILMRPVACHHSALNKCKTHIPTWNLGPPGEGGGGGAGRTRGRALTEVLELLLERHAVVSLALAANERVPVGRTVADQVVQQAVHEAALPRQHGTRQRRPGARPCGDTPAHSRQHDTYTAAERADKTRQGGKSHTGDCM